MISLQTLHESELLKLELNKYIGSKIKNFRESRNMTQDELAEKLETTRQSVSRYENGERKANQDLLFSLASIFNVKLDEFFPPRKESNLVEVKKTTLLQKNAYHFYDGSVAAGLPNTIDAVFEDDLKSIELPDIIMNGYARHKDILIMKVNGDSMNNVIPHDSMIGVKKWEVANLKKNDIVVFSDNGEFSMKRYLNDERNQRIIFRPDSSDDSFSDVVIDYENADNLNILGKVIVSIINYD